MLSCNLAKFVAKLNSSHSEFRKCSLSIRYVSLAQNGHEFIGTAEVTILIFGWIWVVERDRIVHRVCAISRGFSYQLRW
jgi:hypothetical protein